MHDSKRDSFVLLSEKSEFMNHEEVTRKQNLSKKKYAVSGDCMAECFN